MWVRGALKGGKMKGSSLVVYVNEEGEVIGARNVHKESGKILEGEINYGDEEKKHNKKIVGGTLKTVLMYPNACCWRRVGTTWLCGKCP
jgi:hypothetical protein